MTPCKDHSLKDEVRAVFNSPLARRYVFLIVVFGAFLTLIITAVEVYLVYGQQRNELIDTQQEIASLAVPTIGRAVWGFNTGIVETTLRSMVDSGRIDFAKYESDTESISFGELSPYVVSTTYDVYATFKSARYKVGQLELSTDIDIVVVSVFEIISVRLISNFTKTIAMVLFSFFVFHQLVNKHLVSFAHGLRQYGVTNPELPLLSINRKSTAEKHQPDELDELVEAFNFARSELAVRLNQRELAYKEVKFTAARHTKQLQRIDSLMRNVSQNFSFFLDNGTLFYSSVDNSTDAYGAEKLLLNRYGSEKETAASASQYGIEAKLVSASSAHNNSEILQFELSEGRNIWALYVVNSDSGDQAMLLSDVTDISRQNEILTNSRRVAAIGTIAASVAHELNNGLAVLQGRTELLEEWAQGLVEKEELVGPLFESINEINNEIGHLTSSSRQILGFATSTDETDIGFHHVNELGSLADQVMADFVLEDRTALVYIQIDGYISVDLTEFLSSLRNLIKNANEATEPGGKIEVRFRVSKESEIIEAGLDRYENYMAIDVMDDGAGISREMQKRLFSPFASTKPGGRGTGLGLWFVYNFAAKSNGVISYRENDDKGSCFTVFLPVSYRTDEVSWKPKFDRGDSSKILLPSIMVKAPIVVIEDNEKMLDIIKNYLESFGLCVLGSGTVEGAINILSSNKAFSGLVCDLNLPDGLGTQVIERYQRINGKGPKILITGSLRLEGAESKVLNNAIVLSKPFSLSSLHHILVETIPEESSEVCV